MFDRPPASESFGSKWRAFIDEVFATLPLLEDFKLEVWGYLPLVSVREGATRSESAGRPSPWNSEYMQYSERIWRDLSSSD